MRLGILKDIDWAMMGALLAREDHHDQVRFFRALLKECLTWGTHYQVEQQFAYINRELTKEECEMLAMLSFIEK